MQLASTQGFGTTRKRRSIDTVLSHLLSPKPVFELSSQNATNRIEIERYIADKFESSYDAYIHDFMPYLLSMRCLGLISGATGMRPALGSQLFLEQYLDDSIEAEMGKVLQQAIPRESVVEIGNLSATKTGASQIIFLVFTAMLYKAGYQWIVFSATRSLLTKLNKLGFQTHFIGMADPSRLQTSTLDEWGRYYQAGPVVVAGSLENAMEIIQQRPLFRKVMKLYQSRIDELATQFTREV